MNRMYLIALAAVVALAGAAVWAFNTVLEFEKPAVTVKDDLSTIGQGKAIALTVTDRKSGIRSVSVSIAQEGRETELFTRAYPKGTEEEALSVEVNPRARGLTTPPERSLLL